jgi:hypothetical protein
MPHSIAVRSTLLLTLAAALFVYANGLDGPFLFDDHVHITQNRWVKITALDPSSIAQAWNSSFSAFPSDRPLAQLSFGINHALSGLDPWAFKTTNLVIHLLTGLAIFVFTRLAYRALTFGAPDPEKERLVALATAALWLLNPLHVSTVLYAVQRMAQLSSLSMLLALACYFHGRLSMALGKGGRLWVLTTVPVALIGFFAKENTVLLPLLLLASEVSILRGLPAGDHRTFLRAVWVVFIAAPLALGATYLVTHPGLMNFDSRPFTQEERLLTQPRVLWLYIKWLLIPDISTFGLFHDDIATSTTWLSPWTTLPAAVALLLALGAAIVWRRRLPVASFAVLFFLASHALESSILPLEMVFEHRNYLASVGPLFLLAYLVVVTAQRLKVARLAAVLGILLLISYSAVTYLRVNNWTTYKTFLLSSAENHPDSPRSNFMAAQFLISALSNAQGDTQALADAARTLLHNGLAADARCINCLFGLLVLDLHLDRQPDRAVIDRLKKALRTGYVGPTKASITQFSYLVKWHRSDGLKLDPRDLEAIFDAALANPGWNHTGRAGIETAYREYYELVAGDLESALQHARAAAAAWPDQWSYHMHLVRVLRKLGRDDEALGVLDQAARVAGNQSQQQETAAMRAKIQHGLPN